MFTLFSVMTGENWAYVARESMKIEPGWTPYFYIVYIAITSFGIMNVVVAVIVENTLDQALHQKKDLNQKADEERQQATEKILNVFTAADQDGNGELTKGEFLAALERPNVISYLHEVGVDVRQAENLFDILDYDDSGALDASEFLEGVLKARGEAKAKDVLAVQCDMWRSEKKLMQDLRSLRHNVSNEYKALHEEVAKVKKVGLEISQKLVDATSS